MNSGDREMAHSIAVKDILSENISTVLSFYADQLPHALYEQYYWLHNIKKKLTPEQFIIITRKLFMCGLIKEYGEDYYELQLSKRKHVLTDEGDKIYREIAINRGAGEYEYLTHDRNNKEWKIEDRLK